MDPNTTLAEMLDFAQDVRKEWDDDPSSTTFSDAAICLAERVEDLDDWLKGGGALPARWSARNSGPPAATDNVETSQTSA